MYTREHCCRPSDMPFSGLATFGSAFLSKFECSQMPHPLLDHITLVDTPGVLSGEKQRTQRSYDFLALCGHDDKIRVVLNKADQVDTQQVNEFVKRARAAKIHAYIISHLRKEMLVMWGKAKTQRDSLIIWQMNLERFEKFKKLKSRMIRAIDDMLSYDIPHLLKKFINP
ncbi:hypothetical protein Pint_04054 [Pistacia integerrima]|uniref:Uncharacterized protein n=1 Tax=Pistacia integerrima TaxID=434235 RepID=A0ACC0Z2Z4_9ROSI|nr:hypothetical protein Pint_04054 [Pistacia integerrima]